MVRASGRRRTAYEGIAPVLDALGFRVDPLPVVRGSDVTFGHARAATLDVPLVVAARRGEPLLLSLADEQFPMPDGWP